MASISAVTSFRNRFWISTGIALLSYGLLQRVSGTITPGEIVAFETAKTSQRVSALLSQWDGESLRSFQQGIYVDFLLIAGYVGLLYYGSNWFGQLSGNSIFRKAAVFFSWLAVLAGSLDVLENISMLITTNTTPREGLIHFTASVAWLKFSLIFIVLLFMLSSLLYVLINLLSPKSR